MTVEPDNLTTTYAWDDRSQLTRLTDPDGGEYRFAHDAAGRRTLATYPNGMTLAQTYSAASEILAMVYSRPSGEVLESFRYQYDASGNRTEKVFADGSGERYGYDDLSRLTSATYGSGRAVEYLHDPVGNRLEMTETPPAGAPVCAGDADCDTVPDDFDNCPDRTNAGQTDSDKATAEQAGAEAYWAFDEAAGTLALDSADGHDGTLTGSPARLSSGRQGHALRFDGRDDAVTATVPMAGATEASLELFIRTSRTESSYVLSVPRTSGGSNGFDLGFDRAQIRACLVATGGLGCAYSPQNYADGQWHHLAATYDGQDLRLYWDGEHVGTNAAPAGTLYSDHDQVNVGRFGTAGYWYPGDADEVAVYRRALSAEEIARHAGATTLSDGLGDACDPCPASNDPACEPVTCLDDDGDGYGVLGASHCPGGDAAFDCDDQDPAVHPGVVDGCGGLDDDCDGRTDEDCVGAPRTTTYRYNAFNQVLDATDPGGVTAFAWDGNGNQTTKTAPGGEATEYTWDARDRLTEIALPDGTTAAYGYDTENLRASMDDPDGARRVLLDGLEEWGEVDEATGELTARFDHDPTRIDALLAQDSDAGRAAMLTDALGSIYGLADDAAALRARYGYDVYGARSATMEEIGTRWGFTGRSASSGLPLSYARNRYYDPVSSTFLSPDPAWARMQPFDAIVQGQYPYVGGSPTNWADPLGEQAGPNASQLLHFGVGAAISYAISHVLLAFLHPAGPYILDTNGSR